MKELVVRICDLEEELKYVDREDLNLSIVMELANKHSFNVECGDMFAEVCNCFEESKERRVVRYSSVTGYPIYDDVTVTRCVGTKEQDECSCGGDRRQCTFYPEYRK